MSNHQAIIKYLFDSPRPRTREEIAAALALSPKQQDALSQQLRGMVEDGVLVRNRRGGYGLAERMDLVSGHVQAHPDGYGFCIPDDGGVDLFIPPRQMRSLMHGDRIMARQVSTDRQGRRQGEVARILKRAHQQVVGRYMERDGVAWVRPADQRLQNVLIPPAGRSNASSGATVVARLDRQPEAGCPPQGSIVEMMKGGCERDLARDIIIRSCALSYEWPDDVLRELDDVSGDIGAAGSEGREDLTALPLVTIDGESARDFDDAVFCERDAGGDWKLIVAIADVSHYVRPGTALDREARRRATSVYFPGYVLPMLPERLSDDLCSLVPEGIRLCFACEMTVDRSGDMRGYRFFRAVMRSAARLTYNEVEAMMGAGGDRRRDDPVEKSLAALYAVYRCRRRYRQRLGLMEFESVERHIVFDADGRVVSVCPVPRHESHHVIEECMLAANQACARELLKRREAGIYRTHETPAPDRLFELRAFLSSVHLKLGGGDKPTVKDYALLMEQAHERQLGRLISSRVLYSLPLAVYTVRNKGHFGLGFDAYTHFTSPIRRYPDLLAHRLLTGDGAMDDRDMRRLAEHCSTGERRAEEAERQMVRWCQCNYLADRIGETFHGVITGVRPFGVFVEINGIGVDGLVHVTMLPGDYYHFDADSQSLRGANRGHVYRLAESVTVQLTRVDMENRRIDMKLIHPG